MKPEKRTPSLLWLLLFGVFTFNVADYFLTLYALKSGFKEGNPLMNLIVDTAYFAKVKLLLVPLLLLLLWLGRKQIGHRLYYYVWLIFLAYTFLMLYYVWLFWSEYL